MRDQWSAERLSLLKGLWKSGAPASAIAAQLGGLSRSAVLGKIFRLRRRGRAGKALVSRSPMRARGRDKSIAPGGTGKTLLELTNSSCRWPHGRPGAPNFFFCGAPGADLESGTPYCPHHAQRAYHQPSRIPEPANQTTAPADGAPTLVPDAPAPTYEWRASVPRPAQRSK